MDAGDLNILTLLDLSVAFDTVDYRTLLTRLEVSCGVEDAVLCRFTSDLDSRSQCVHCGSGHDGLE